jgi:hypothetical protein
LDIFAHAGKVNALIVTLAGMDFDNASLQPQAVLRTNSHLTNLFKAFTARFGRRYHEKVIGKLVAYIQQSGPIQTRNPSREDKELGLKMIVTCLRTIIRSRAKIPPQFSHMAAVLKGVSGYRFNNKQAVFNTLSGFFSLRFLNGQISTWDDSEPEQRDVESAIHSAFLPQFSQLLQTTLSLMVYGGSHDTFIEWNHHLITHMFPEVMNFTLSLADAEGMPEYPPSGREGLERAMGVVVQAMVENKDKFLARYAQLARDTEEHTPITWVLGSFLMSFFESTIAE